MPATDMAAFSVKPPSDALAAALVRLRPGLELLSLPACVVDHETRYGFANDAYCACFGVQASDIIGRTPFEVFRREPEDKRRNVLAQAMAGKSQTFDRIMVDGPKRGRWVRAHYMPVHGENEIVGVAVILVDIQHLKDAEGALRERERHLSLLMDSVGFPITYVDRDGIIRFANEPSLQWAGVTRETAVGHHYTEHLPEAVRAKSEPLFGRALEGEEITYEREALWPGRELRRIRGHMIPDRDESGTVRGVLIVLMDIEEDYRLKESLLDRTRELLSITESVGLQQRQLRFYAENIPETIAFIDAELRYQFVNKTFEHLLGAKAEDVVGRHVRDIMGDEAAARYFDPFVDRLRRGETCAYEHLTGPAGEARRWFHVRLQPHVAADGSFAGCYMVGHDIHELKSTQSELHAREEELRQVIDSVPTPMVYVDAGYRYRYVNHAFLDYIGKPAREAVGQTVEAVLGSDRWVLMQPILRRVEAGEAVSYERIIDYSDGRSRWMSIRLTPRHDESGRYLGYYAVASDIHEQKLIAEELRKTSEVLSAHFDNTPLAVIEWDPQGRPIRWSGNAQAIFGWSADEVLGRPRGEWRLVFEEDKEGVKEMVRRLMAGPETQATQLNRNYRKDGSVIWVEWHNSALRDAQGRLVSILSLAQDVSSRIQAEERLQHMATHDGLTGLPNRLLLTERLENAITRAQRFGHRVAVMFLDLDHFKDVNDTLGHRVGDELLKDLARRVRGLLRQSDFLVRLSGDEFIIVLEDLEGDRGPDRVAQKILDDVLRPFPIEGQDVQVSASLGFALYPDDGEDSETLLKNADTAMYHAKELGRNSYRAFSRTIAQRRDQRLGLEAALKRALQHGEFALHYQPILDVMTSRVSHVEALLRWNDPERGMVLPASFIPAAEEAGLMRDLGHWVFETAARQAVAWRAAGMPPLTVCVNLSASQLRDSTIVPELESVLARTGCSPTWLTLEITETSMLKDVEGVSVTLRKLRRTGLRIAIDDFGTGFSSLSHLRHLPVDTLKIDKSFVADLYAGDRRVSDSGGAAIIAAVTGLARGLGLEVVAEGVEHASQLDFLREHGCGAFQGYLACPPLPAMELERWHATHVVKKSAARRKPKKN